MQPQKISIVIVSLLVMGAFLSALLQHSVSDFIVEKSNGLAQTLFGVSGISGQTQSNANNGFINDATQQDLFMESLLAATNQPEFCVGNNDERDYLYNVETVISTKGDGTKTFTSKRRSDGKVLRQSFADEQFFVPRGVNDVTYNIIEKCGGVDIVYTVKNNTVALQAAPDFRVDGIMQNTRGDFYVLDTNNTGNLRRVNSGSTLANIFLGGSGAVNTEGPHLDYPDFYYSPVLVSHDGDFAAGTAFLYPYLQYKHGIIPQITKVTSGTQAGTWRHEYKNTSNNNPGNVLPSQQRTYIVSVRFTEPRSWLFTLERYKKYYKQVYGNTEAVRPQDLNPVLGEMASQMAYFNAQTNPRSYGIYTYQAPLITEGLRAYVTGHLQNMQEHGFKRTMIWALAGLYPANADCQVVDPNLQIPYSGGQWCNYPPAFMDFPPHIEASSGELSRFAENGIELGFWWGRAAFVPTPQTWNPTRVDLISYANPAHINFANNQLLKAYQKGTKVIGLDAFGGEAYEKYTRIDAMKSLTNNSILFIHEGVGPDILHKKIANFYSPSQFTWWTQFDKTNVSGPDVLSRYLNPGAEIWLYNVNDAECDEIQDQINWGFTPVMSIFCSGRRVNVSSFRIEENQCFDQIDNDGDGRKDWPFDRGCLDAKDNSENSERPLTGVSTTRNIGPTEPPTDLGGNNPGSGGTRGGGRSGGSRGGNTNQSLSSLLQQIQQLQAILASLQAQLAARNAATGQTYVPPRTGSVTRTTPTAPAPAAYVSYNRDLDVGSEGADVAQLQRFLVSRGFLQMPAGATYGHYGVSTRDAVARLQLFSGISPVNGHFGPTTRDRVNQF